MRSERRIPVAIALLGVLAVGLCGGCANTGAQPDIANTVETSPAGSLSAERDPVLDLLEYAAHLDNATPEERADAVIHARRHVAEAPGALNYAQLAVAFAAPGQRRYTPDEAARYAELALSANDARWSTAAEQYLHDMARVYGEISKDADSSTPRLASETRSPIPVPATTPPATADPGNESARVKALERELDEAHRKLRELADIEDRLSDPGS